MLQRPSNTKLDLRNAANSLQIEGNWGCYLGTQPWGGEGGWRDGGRDHIYISRHNIEKYNHVDIVEVIMI